LVQVLTRTDRQTERALLEHLDATVPEIADQVRAKMFLFEDIAKLDDRTIQRIMRELDLKELAKALKGASEEMRAAIFRNMSSRAAEMLQDELEAMGPMRADQLSRAQRNIINIVRRLEEQEEIVINRGGETDMV
jgi:flagellar motor switch protein FliG